MFKAEIVGHSIDPRGNELISFQVTFPRIILAEVLTHRMFSRNTSSSRAIPFKKMVEAIENNPFIPIAWQKSHSGMQGTEYHGEKFVPALEEAWLIGRDKAINTAMGMYNNKVTKQLCNRLLEPYMWTTMLITTSKEGLENFFKLRCPQYEYNGICYKSKKDAEHDGYGDGFTDVHWMEDNISQAEIHIQKLAEMMYDAYNENEPEKLKVGNWHIPYRNVVFSYKEMSYKGMDYATVGKISDIPDFVKVATSMAARTSYTVIEGKETSWEKHLELHERLISYDPPHSSPFEHCARVMSNNEYEIFLKGMANTNYDKMNYDDEYNKKYLTDYELDKLQGWCDNFKGFIPYRHMVDNKMINEK